MKPNHLAHEKSPYLLQHAHNPVDWYAWGEEAFAKARREDKPILVSIGYSTCHWCHVMERESFSDPVIAAQMNKDFVCIKVDREERPDVDKIYMTAVQAMTGQGGWPLNVFLTPELKPFYGGTYFPPEARWGQPGFPALLKRIAELWRNNRGDINSDAKKLAGALESYASAAAGKQALDSAWLEAAFKSYEGSFDPEHAGFGGAPKFPMPVNQSFLLRYHARSGSAEALKLAAETLSTMARGGVYDQLGGGFHRYSTDAQWRVPHFEKMLYDNAQLAVNFVEAYQATREPEFSRVARETLDYVLRDMTSPEGGFYSAEDADSLPQELALKGVKDEGHSHKAEGAFYLWTEEELKTALGPDADLFVYRYGVTPGGNSLADPHGEFQGKNVLYAAHTVEDAARRYKRKRAEGEAALAAARTKLLAQRAHRPKPGLDDKVLSAWNGLMISALAKGAQALGERRYLDAAAKAATFLRSELYAAKIRTLWRRWRLGSKAVPGIADDYAFVAQGALDLYEASFDLRWLEWALELTEEQVRRFGSPEGGFYMTEKDKDSSLLLRVMEDSDNVEPSASSVGALNLLRLAQFTGRKDLREAAERTLERFGPLMAQRGMAQAYMLCAADFALSKPRQIVIAGGADEPGTAALLKEVNGRFMPVKILLRVDDSNRERLAKLLPFLKTVVPVGGKPTAYVCENYACKLPTNDLEQFKTLLDGKPAARR
ncbi:MAG: thioredoxin domain-containing protein [Elusimicrobia bacterium]|nr:thioredoxin domain-containing protein [Elusimicrobiota bacterium]